MNKLQLEPQPAAAQSDRENLVAILLVLDEILTHDGCDAEVVVDKILPRVADDVRAALKRNAHLKTVLEEQLEVRDQRIAQLERQLAEQATELDDERTKAEQFARHIRTCSDEFSPFEAIDCIDREVNEFLLRF